MNYEHSGPSPVRYPSRFRLGVALIGIVLLALGSALITGWLDEPDTLVSAAQRADQLQSTTTRSAELSVRSTDLKIEDVEKRLPALQIQGQTFSVVIHKKRLVWPSEAHHSFHPDDDETAVRLEVRDANESVVFGTGVDRGIDEKEFREIRTMGRFPFSDYFSVTRVQGIREQALIIGSSTLPSAPDACADFQILGLFNRKLVPFSEPFCEDLIFDESDALNLLRLKIDPQTGFEVFEVRRNLGYFRVIAPVRVDFRVARLLPARSCLRSGGSADTAEYCEFPVEAERRVASEDSFVRLFPSPDPDSTPRHVVVRPDSQVEFLFALVANFIGPDGKWHAQIDGELSWLKVRISGSEGWVRDEEDLMALGLFQAG